MQLNLPSDSINSKLNKITETNRLIIRDFVLEDLDDLHRIYGNPGVMRLIGKGARTKEETLEELKSFIKQREQYGFSCCAVILKEPGQLIGRAGIYRNERSFFPQLGYVLDLPYHGKGLGTEAAKASLEYGFNLLKLERIVAFAMLENTPSRHIIGNKLGMHCETENFEYCERHYAYYSISRSEYLVQVSSKSEILTTSVPTPNKALLNTQ